MLLDHYLFSFVVVMFLRQDSHTIAQTVLERCIARLTLNLRQGPCPGPGMMGVNITPGFQFNHFGTGHVYNGYQLFVGRGCRDPFHR